MLVKRLREVRGIKRWQSVEVLNTHLSNKGKYVLIINKCAYRNNSNIYPQEGCPSLWLFWSKDQSEAILDRVTISLSAEYLTTGSRNQVKTKKCRCNW